MNAVDTNVFVYAIDDGQPIKQPLAQTLIAGLAQQPAQTKLPWQVATEFLQVLRRWQSQGRIDAQRVDEEFDDLLELFDLALPTHNTLQVSRSLISRYSLSHWDSLLVAACIEAGVDTLYSEDMGDGAVYDSVTIINPLKSPGAAN